MARVTPQQFQEKHANNLKASTTYIQQGIERVSESPTLKAAAKKDKMRAGILKSIDEGKWEAGLKRVTLEDWKTAAINKGVPRIAAGIDGAAAKVVEFASQLLPHIDTGVAQVNKMNDVTLEDNIQRMVTMTRHMAKFKRK